MIVWNRILATGASVIGIIVVCTAFGHRVSAGILVYKCMKNGQLTLTDKPCDGSNVTAPESNINVPGIVPSSKNPSPVGSWAGEIQYQEAQNGKVVQAAHSVALLKAELTADGRVTGLSDSNGCKWLGVWSDGGQTLIWIDVTLSGCAYVDFNRRYHGSFILARPDNSGQITGQSLGVAFSSDVGKAFDIKGTLRR